jgi:flagellar biosynthesis protein FlhG
MDQSTSLRRLVLASGRTLGGDAGPPPRLVVVAGGKASVGATTLAVNLAVALASHGSRTVLIDADLRADVAAHCGLAAGVGITDVLLNRKDIHEVLQRGPGGTQVAIGASTPEARNAWTDRAVQRVVRQIQSLGRHADLVLIDTGHTAGQSMLPLWQAADEVLLVTTPDAVAVMDSYATVKTLLTRSAARPPICLIVNQADDADEAADVHRRIDQSCQRFLGLSVPLAGWSPPDSRTQSAHRRGQPLAVVAPQSPFAQSIDRLAETVLAPPTIARPTRRAA